MSYGYGAPPPGAYDGYGHPPPPGAGYPPYGYPAPSHAYPPRYDYGPPPSAPQYPPPYPPHYPHPPPPQPMHPSEELRPPHDVGVDPNSFRRFFMANLSTLNFNSKPVITNLTLFAHEHLVRMSGVVASCLDEHLRNCPPAFKLPALYLLDSISKNIGPPYVALFGRFIERTFLSAYHAVDPSTKVKMEELLGTWRTGGPDGGELFRTPEEGSNGRVQRGIEMALFGAGGKGGGMGGKGKPLQDTESYQSGLQQLPAAATTGERSGVLFDVRRLLQLRQDQAALRPEDQVNKSQIDALQKLESLVLNTQLTSDQVNQIRGQLAALAPADPTPVALPPPMDSPVKSLDPLQQSLSAAAVVDSSSSLDLRRSPSVVPPPPSEQQPTSAVQGIDLNLLAQLQGLSGGLSSLFAPAVPTALTTTTTSTAPSVVVAPIASANGAGGRGGTPAPVDPDEKATVTVLGPDPLIEEYNEALLSLDVHLTKKDLELWRPESLSFLYDRLSLQCKQCGLRFFDSVNGKLNMDAHLDWHFTHKRRIREGAGRAQGRSWLSLEEDWIHADDVTLLDSAHDPSSSSSTTNSKNLLPKINRAELLAKKVPAPTDASKPCPICKEKFQSEFSEVDEEWMFGNAVEVDGTIYHATCRAEATSSRLGSRLRATGDDSTRPSRENTPTLGGIKSEEMIKTESNGGSAQKKRKTEEIGGKESGEGGDEAQRKKAKSEVV